MILCLAVLGLGVLCLTELGGGPGGLARAQSGGGPSGYTFTTIDVSVAGTGPLEGTIGVSINAPGGDITGVYITTPNVAHGFVRSGATGTITTFDAPNAGTGKNQGTFPVKVETSGRITGMYVDSNNAYHGFVRDSSTGTITEFDVPGAPTTIGHRGTIPLGSNGGVVTGFYVDANAVRHGFVRGANGTVTTFDVSGAGVGSTQGTIPVRNNSAGDITGFYIDATQTFHAFIRAANGTITAPIDAPGASTGVSGKGTSFRGTVADAADPNGNISGIYTDANLVFHGFVRSSSGTITPFNAPSAGTTGLFPGTLPTNIDAGGDITGFYDDASGESHGFVMLAVNGAVAAPLDAPNAASTGMLSGTVPFAINATGDLTGAFIDTNSVFHGFLANAPEVATPSFSPAAGTYPTTQMVAISDTTPGATIFFTTDGSTPTTASTQFTNPITVSFTTTIKAFAIASGFEDSSVASATYTIAPPAATPTFAPPAGTYTSVQSVTISDTTPGAAIHYTTNGNTPTSSDTVFTNPISVGSTETIKAIAIATGFSNSAVASALYTINLPTPDFQLSVNPSSLTIVAGQSGKATFTVTPQNGFNSPVSFACSGLPAEASCSFSPASVTPNGAAVSSTLTIATVAASTALRPPAAPSQPPPYALLVSLLAISLAIVARRRPVLRVAPLFALLILLLVASGLTSCNSAGNPGTPIGTSTVSVSASAGAGGTNHSASLTVTITH